ncbi:GCN5-related N-acetyltransferase [Haladaptatus paucihalophilus DX253]|uniref:GCN5-related N-acetyltransferase n=1 Tax=Haladaptatus paucihalophilus DX253 TaxID=797209 RepID=E7QMP1_HALPU|nr:GNAT family protein [Haladaptatus paucihalophilus]EFW94225.1 GCN5-related N-acetyltransferase [Haladaptatus paucihalophilus DX253]SHL34288.1 Protein N-acetyltransferase, RimJ/RimL family [Haladaptatus paucihalophilus DX253]
MLPESLSTKRLRHERLCHENVDLFELYHICSTEDGIDEITRYMPWSPHETVNETKTFVDESERKWNDRESLKYIIRPNDDEDGSGEFAGLTGLKLNWSRRTGTQWIWLRKSFWGRGYNSESALALIDLTLDRFDLDLFAVTHAAENEKSKSAIERYIEEAGGQRDGVLRNWVPHDDHVSDEIRYTVTQEQWQSGQT